MRRRIIVEFERHPDGSVFVSAEACADEASWIFLPPTVRSVFAAHGSADVASDLAAVLVGAVIVDLKRTP